MSMSSSGRTALPGRSGLGCSWARCPARESSTETDDMVTARLSLMSIVVLGLVTVSEAQQADTLFTLQHGVAMTAPVGVIESVPLESVTSVPNAPFSADAETEFTQVLGDGNRIERRYSSMMAR